jgi:hypothetical protein
MPESPRFQTARDMLRAGVLHAAGVPVVPVPAREPEEPALPPGVLGYAVAVYPGGGPGCSGLTHTGLMTAEAAAREAAGHAAAARNEPSSPYHAGCEYRTVEIREADGG